MMKLSSSSSKSNLSKQPENHDPPAYTSSLSGPSQPEFTFTIGSKKITSTLVQFTEVKSHLALLHAFHELRTVVQAEEHPFRGPGVPQDAERRWGWFVALAVERFHKWCQSLVRGLDSSHSWSTIMPPIDVIMVWHAYMLNPKWYGEDGLRGTTKALRELDGHFAKALHSTLHEYLAALPSPTRVAFWEMRTSLPFHYASAMTSMIRTEIKCPLCLGIISVDYMKQDGTGYLQEGFRASCPNGCGIGHITKEKLGVRRFADDLSDPLAVIAGTDFQAPSHKDRFFSNAAQVRVLEAAQIEIPCTIVAQEAAAVSLMKWANFKLEKLGGAMVFTGPDRRCGRILSAYRDDRPYSLDLAGAVLRQASFVKKMYDLGWTQQGVFEGLGNEVVLQHAVARYHGFLDLLSSSPTSFYVPTLDIDLVWHTHQLLCVRYEKDTVCYIGRFIDHDDKVEGLRLSNSFDITCKAWKDRFKVPYTHCGCPHPGQKAEDLQKSHKSIDTSKLFSKVLQSASSKIPVTSHTNPDINKDDLVPPTHRSDALSASHPSDHNAVHFSNPPIVAKNGRDIGKFRHQRMVKKYDSLMKHRAQRVKKLQKKRGVLVDKYSSYDSSSSATSNSNDEDDDEGDDSNSVMPHRPIDPKADPDDDAYSAYYNSFLAPFPVYYVSGRTQADPIPAPCVASQGDVVFSAVAGCGNCGSSGDCGGGSCGGGGYDNLQSGNCNAAGSSCGSNYS
ncbi:hypothetical protein BJ165DRAFT_433608 [Panaeolus papilionaceus]|nr:hypothetical protein BJ165DRAFT_433608 [Panaeolus papilionaceus]